MKLLILLPVAFVALGGEAQALECTDAADQTAMNQCASKQYKATDAAMAKVYKDLMAKVSDEGKPLLRDAERAWIAYRDKECAFETAVTVGGSINPFVLLQCLKTKTEVHMAELKAQLNCEEGDVSCGAQ